MVYLQLSITILSHQEFLFPPEFRSIYPANLRWKPAKLYPDLAFKSQRRQMVSIDACRIATPLQQDRVAPDAIHGPIGFNQRPNLNFFARHQEKNLYTP